VSKAKDEDELWAKLRDWLNSGIELKESIDEVLGKKVEVLDHPEWNTTGIVWVEAQGTRGPYLRAEKQESSDYVKMISDLRNHNGKITRQGEFFWLFSDGETVGRKPKGAGTK